MKALTMVALAAGMLIALGAPASAGENMHVDVNKVVVGTAPPGTTFTVHFACTDGGPSGDLTFNAAGNPVPASSNFFNDGVVTTSCTITETGTGGATSVTYACQDDGVNATCDPAGNAVKFDSPTNNSNNVTFTVTNTYGGATPTTTAPSAPSAPEPAAPVSGTPVFTG
jgi:hypothetical protein